MDKEHKFKVGDWVRLKRLRPNTPARIVDLDDIYVTVEFKGIEWLRRYLHTDLIPVKIQTHPLTNIFQDA